MVIGQTVTFATSDHQDADTRELDGTKAVVLAVARDDIFVNSQYGQRWADRFDFEEA